MKEKERMKETLEILKFDRDGLIPAIVQDHASGEVLMMAYMNREAVAKSLETGFTHFFSRSRQQMWMKGESSGHVQAIKEILYDCDADCLLVRADQRVAACHTGHRSCFYRAIGEEGERGETVFDSDRVYGGQAQREILDRLFGVIAERKRSPREDSYTSRLLEGGKGAVGEKVLEEAGELVKALREGPERVVHEAADLIYHAWVLLAMADVTPRQVRDELARRFGKSGLEEKAERK